MPEILPGTSCAFFLGDFKSPEHLREVIQNHCPPPLVWQLRNFFSSRTIRPEQISWKLKQNILSFLSPFFVPSIMDSRRFLPLLSIHYFYSDILENVRITL